MSPRSLVIGIDARAAAEERAGRGRVMRELLQALARRKDSVEYHLFARERWDADLDHRFHWQIISSHDVLWNLRTAGVANRTCDVFLAANSYLTARLVSVPTVVIVYDLVAFDRKTEPNRRAAFLERLTLRPVVTRAAGLWCISEATSRVLIARYPTARGRVTVIPLAAAIPPSRAPQPRCGLPAPGFVLSVGTLEPRKNLPRVAAAFASLSPELQKQHPLVVVGARGWRSRSTMSALESLGPRCRLLGHVPDEKLAELYRRCAVFCYPSLGEGFGLPVLEAMSAGAPVLTSNLSSLPEVGAEAVEYVNPFSTESIATGLRRLLESPEQRAKLSVRARERARAFSWESTAASVMNLLRTVSIDRGSSPPRPSRSPTSTTSG